MKKLFLLLLMVFLLPAAACGTGPAAMTELSPEQAVAEAKTTEELHTMLVQYEQDQCYDMALLAAERILELDPTETDMYDVKAALRIKALRAGYDALNGMLAKDIGSVDDPAAYRERIQRMYDEAELTFQMPFIPDYASQAEINRTGNTPGNLAGIVWAADGKPNAGAFAAQGNWIYYADGGDGLALCKIRCDGTSRQKLCGDGACSVNVIGDWIYFCNISEDYTLYRIRTDGSMKTQVSKDSCEELCISDNEIFYTGQDNGGELCKVGTDGSGRQSLSVQAKGLFIVGEYLYYTSRDEKNLYRMSLDGSLKETLIKDEWNRLAQIEDDMIYYLADQKGLVVMRMKTDGSDRREMWRYDAKINFFTLNGGRLIAAVRNREDREEILAYDLDTMEQVLKLANTSTEAILSDAEGSVYYISETDRGTLYRINWDKGTSEKIG